MSQNTDDRKLHTFTLNSILDAINHDVILISDDGKVRYVNVYGRKNFFACLEVEAIDRYFNEVFSEVSQKVNIINRSDLENLINEVHNPTSFIQEAVKINVKYSNYDKSYEVITSPIYDPLIGHLGRLWQFRDITVSENLEGLKSEFISIASHQLRTPLTSIKGYVSMTLEGDYGQVPQPLMEPLESVSKASNQMSTLIEDLLNISRLEKGDSSGEMAEFDLIKLVSEIIEELKPRTIEKRLAVEVKLDTPSNSLLIKSDKEKIHEAFKNLIENAIKYTPENKKIMVELQSDGDDYVKIYVQDQGIGIPKIEQDRIFEKFFRASNVKVNHIDGTGLGLYYVRRVIKEIGGSIAFKSEESQGTTFVVTIPLLNS